MEYTNEWITNRAVTKTNLDSSFGLFLPTTSGKMVGDISMGTDASLIISGYNDTSIFHITVDNLGVLKANEIQ